MKMETRWKTATRIKIRRMSRKRKKAKRRKRIEKKTRTGKKAVVEEENHREAAQKRHHAVRAEEGTKRKAGGDDHQEVHLEAHGGEGGDVGMNVGQSAVAVDPAGSARGAVLAVPVTPNLKEDHRRLTEY